MPIIVIQGFGKIVAKKSCMCALPSVLMTLSPFPKVPSSRKQVFYDKFIFFKTGCYPSLYIKMMHKYFCITLLQRLQVLLQFMDQLMWQHVLTKE
jgi:hypothetical protein